MSVLQQYTIQVVVDYGLINKLLLCSLMVWIIYLMVRSVARNFMLKSQILEKIAKLRSMGTSLGHANLIADNNRKLFYLGCLEYSAWAKPYAIEFACFKFPSDMHKFLRGAFNRGHITGRDILCKCLACFDMYHLCMIGLRSIVDYNILVSWWEKKQNLTEKMYGLAARPIYANETDTADDKTDTKPMDTKPMDTKPMDTKPMDTKPMDTTEPMDKTEPMEIKTNEPVDSNTELKDEPVDLAKDLAKDLANLKNTLEKLSSDQKKMEEKESEELKDLSDKIDELDQTQPMKELDEKRVPLSGDEPRYKVILNEDNTGKVVQLTSEEIDEIPEEHVKFVKHEKINIFDGLKDLQSFTSNDCCGLGKDIVHMLAIVLGKIDIIDTYEAYLISKTDN